jgi:hypothetical protein
MSSAGFSLVDNTDAVVFRRQRFVLVPRPTLEYEQNMSMHLDPRQLDALRAYAAGRLGTRDAIERAGMHDYADLLIGMAQNDLDLPKPAATPMHDAHLARARAILQPRLRRDG